MAQILAPDGRTIARAPNKGKDLITYEQAAFLVLEAVGPLAVAFEEMKAKVATLEDRLGITDHPTGGDV